MQNNCEELKQKLDTTEAEKQSQFLKMTAEIDDLNRTKTNLEERLIELIRYDLFLLQLSAVLTLSVATGGEILNEERGESHLVMRMFESVLPVRAVPSLLRTGLRERL